MGTLASPALRTEHYSIRSRNLQGRTEPTRTVSRKNTIPAQVKTNLKASNERSFLESSGDSVKGTNCSPRIAKESELIAAILTGETQLYHQLIRPYERSVYMMSLCYVKNEADAEDVTQEAFIRAFRNLAAFRASRSQYLAYQHCPERSEKPNKATGSHPNRLS